MFMADQAPAQLCFSFKYDHAYRIVASNGAWVALTPRGDVRLDFFVESPEVPQFVVHAIDQDGKVGNVIQREPQNDLNVVRSVQIGVLLSVKEAESLSEVLGRQIKIWKEADEERKK